MWRNACKRLYYSIHAVLLKTSRSGNTPLSWHTNGSCFRIKNEPEPLFITSAHVVLDEDNRPYDENDIALVLFLPGKRAAPCSVQIIFIEESSDIAVLRAAKEAQDTVPALFSEPCILEIGSAVASIGFPIPPPPETHLGGGRLKVIRRLSTGFISSADISVNFNQATENLKHYEINMLTYPGISGAPVFDIHGLVVGINRGGLLVGQSYTAYAYAIRSPEIFACLRQNKIRIEFGNP
jgi:S1-C subfamily serine protease